MAAFSGMQITNQGRALQAKAQTGVELRFTRISLGDGQLTGQEISELTNLIDLKKSLEIMKLQVRPGGTAVVGGYLSNQDMVTGFYFRELGIFAQDPDVGEILYAYDNAGSTAEYIPAGSGSSIIEKYIDLNIIIKNAANVSAVIDQSLIFATQQDLIDHKEALTLDHPDGSVTTVKLADKIVTQAKIGDKAVGSGQLGDGAATDTIIGDRTISDTTAPAGNSGKLGILLGGLAYMIKAITGKSIWRMAPATTLEDAKGHMDQTTGAHDATSAATPEKIIERDAAGRAKVAAPSASDDIARKDTVDNAIAAHKAESDPHPGYAKDSEIAAIRSGLYEEAIASLLVDAGTNIVPGGQAPAFAYPETTGRTLINLIGDAGSADSLKAWATMAGVLSLDASNKTQGNNGFKLQNTTTTDAYAQIDIKSIAEGKYLILVADAKNGDAVSADLTFRFFGNSTVADSRGSTTDTTRFKTIWAAATPENIAGSTNVYVRLEIKAGAVANKTVYFDAIRVYEISAAEYAALATMSESQIAAKYPYLGAGIFGVTGLAIESVQDNLLSPYSEWQQFNGGDASNVPAGMYKYDDYSLTIDPTKTSTGTETAVILEGIPVQPNAQYTLNNPSPTGYMRCRINSRNGVETRLIFPPGSRTFMTPDGAYAMALVACNLTGATDENNPSTYTYQNTSVISFNNPVLVPGATATFKPQRKTRWFGNKTFYSSLDGSLADKMYFEKNNPKRLAYFESIVLDGSLRWSQLSSHAGYKQMDSPGLPSSVDPSKAWFTKFDGKPLTFVNSAAAVTGADFGYLNTSGTVRVSIASADSGWGDNYTPTADEIKAYFYGWQMSSTANAGAPITIYNDGTGAARKYWRSISSGGYTDDLPTKPDTNGVYTPYQLLYRLATPSIQNVRSEGSAVLKAGENHVTVSSSNVPANPVLLNYPDSLYSALSEIEREIAGVRATAYSLVYQAEEKLKKDGSDTMTGPLKIQPIAILGTASGSIQDLSNQKGNVGGGSAVYLATRLIRNADGLGWQSTDINLARFTDVTLQQQFILKGNGAIELWSNNGTGIQLDGSFFVSENGDLWQRGTRMAPTRVVDGFLEFWNGAWVRAFSGPNLLLQPQSANANSWSSGLFFQYRNSAGTLVSDTYLEVSSSGLLMFTKLGVASNEVWHRGNNPAVLGATGYQKLANGPIIQWGSLSVDGSTPITFPIAFPSACVSFTIGDAGIDTKVASLSKTGASLTNSSARTVYWMAIGY